MQRIHRTSISLGALRLLATLFVLQVLLQVGLAASFVSGNTAIFHLHSINGSLMNTVPFVMIVTAILHATLARGARWPLVATSGLLGLCFVQEILGYTRVIGAHIVGGTLVLTVSVLLCVGLWRLRYAPRPPRGSTPPTDVGASAPTAGVPA